ncbi:MAG: hypothetical protein LBH53_02085 [Puniceicoccales bacterium]|jgi:hypothetical protein|nr:hypothetical protein [Puniceicoccales bacterium]
MRNAPLDGATGNGAVQDSRSFTGKVLLITATVVALTVFTGTFTMWLALKVFCASLGAATLLVTGIVSWATPVAILVCCLVGAVWLFWYWRLEPAAKAETAPAATV